ncbi:uncharacterized protein LOC108734776 [Agrilus planipennis]|uniref:Uncharacterized protein LOC108734776 n=1 Tax=Agrilus planipennis TaxID=224129 RepID=A0A7F5RMM3_AGRPL|nr:uncharacterized protein LOC108734776 [Agrilus planipennis]
MSGYLGNSRVVIDHYDVSTQADIQHTAVSYESEDEALSRLFGRGRRGTPSYSKQDILEQYCISDRGLGALEQDRRSLFSCLSMQQASPCSNRTSLLTVCVRQKVPSDENLQDIVRRYPAGYDPYYKRLRYPWIGSQPVSDIYSYNEESDCSYFRKRSRIDPRKYTWMPSDDESVRLERPRSLLDQYNPATLPPPPPPAITRPKHVSFARSHTMTSFDDTSVSFVTSPYQNVRMSRSQERLLGLRRSVDPLPPITRQPTSSDNVASLEKLKRVPASMKSQATQTEACLGRKPILPGKVHFNPWPLNRASMVSQAAQTNGILINGRKLLKSYSEIGGGRFNTICKDTFPKEPFVTHDPLCRTQSDEPPRSPFVVTTPPHLTKEIKEEESPLHSHQIQMAHESETSDESESNLQEEIIIDFEPRFSSSSPIEIVPKKTLQKTLSDGEILLDQRRLIKEEIFQTKTVSSLSHENLKDQSDSDGFVPYFRNSPIRNEGVFRKLQDSVYSSISDTCEGIGLPTQDSIEEEFHETLIYKGRYLRRSGSSTSDDILEDRCGRKPERLLSLEDESVVPVFERKPSPFTSNDSLANDVRDHSDGIWNESQVTVLQVDSGTENGTGLSSSEITSLSAPAATTSIQLLTPSTRRKNLLLQHLQRSSMDIDALDEESIDTTQIQPELPKICKESAQHISPKTPEYKNQQFLTAHPIHKQPPPLTKKRPVEQKPESPLPAVVPELPLARTDSGKTNTDISESTTTTDDYITATSGTDSSKKSVSNREAAVKVHSSAVIHDGSSFESASSIYGQAKSDVFGDDMVVPSFSPPLILEETCTELKVVVCSRGGSAPEPSSPSPSSSSGSYSLDGSCSATSPQKPAVPSSRRVPSVSEDERSARYSSSGYYESPLDDEPTWKSDRLGRASDEKNQKKKKITVEITKHQKWDEKPSTSEKQRPSSKHTKKTDDEQSLTKDLLKVNGKVKRTRTRTRSPLQSQRRSQQSKRSPSSLRTSPSTEQSGFEKSNHDKKFSVTSDDSSSGLCGEKVPSGQASPRKREKKMRDIGRKKSISRSPVGSKTRRKEDEKPSSLPGSLPRRKSGVQVSSSEKNLNSSKTTLSPRSVSPADSPTSKRRLSHSKTSPETTRLKALSAESLRSVSPGSDSVFYSDPSSQAATSEHQVHCLHCGKEVDIVTTDDPDRRSSRSGSQADIVQPPAGFADSPRSKHVSGKLYKKFEKRFRSEERQAERRHHRHRFDARAKKNVREVAHGRSLAPNHMLVIAKATIAKTAFHPPCSPDVAPSDYRHFAKLKEILAR